MAHNYPNGNYFIGIDLGTSSIGWAATDENFKLLRLKGKTAWGSRIFDEAEDSKARRTFRTSGRRLARRRHRIVLLQNIFNDEIKKIDQTFFLRLNESSLHNDDKDISVQNLFPFFVKKEKEKEYHFLFPTIWHLREALCDKNNKLHEKAISDIRYIYLALHHIIKYRGNFLSEQNIEDSAFSEVGDILFLNLNKAFKQIHAKFFENDEDNDDYELISLNNKKNIVDILCDIKLGIREKKACLEKFINKTRNNDFDEKYLKLLIALLVGKEASLKKAYDLDEEVKISFTKDFDENSNKFHEIMGEDFEFIENLKLIYDSIYIKKLLGNSHSLSASFINVYNQHKSNLTDLKKIVRYIDEIKKLKGKDSNYFKFFKDKESSTNYSSLVGHDSNKVKASDGSDFYKDVFKLLSENVNEIKSWNNNQPYKINIDELIQKSLNGELFQTSVQLINSAIPHQLHQHELSKIIDNCSDKFPFLKERKDDLMKLFLFKIPYYFGPLNDNKDICKYSSIVKKEGEKLTKITPWNIDEIIDKNQTREKFISSLTNFCTYLPDQPVLPINSILYQDFIVLNRINSLGGGKTRLDDKIRKDILGLISSKSTMTPLTLINQIKKIHPEFVNENVEKILNTNDNFNCSSRFLFNKVFQIGKDIGDLPINLESKAINNDFDKVENIIYILEIFADDRASAIEYIEEKYGKLSKEQKHVVSKYKCGGWGSLSKKLLTNFYPANENGEIYNQNIYHFLLKGYNFQQILFCKVEELKPYSYFDAFDLYKKDLYKSFTINDEINNILEKTPSIMRRPTIQAYKIIDEIISVKKELPKSIIIETTRENQIKKNPSSRKKELNDFLNSLKKDIKLISDNEYGQNLIKELNEKDNLLLKSKHLYLYFKQLGFDLYTGKKINIEDVLDSSKYDIDHIYPKSKLYDDSLDNTVLVSREINQKIKKDIYPIPQDIRNNPNVQKLWNFLLKKNAISYEKYSRLTRSIPLTGDEIYDFIHRQINVVNFSNIALRDILNLKYNNKFRIDVNGSTNSNEKKDVEIIFTKASTASFIRQEFNIPKLRELNDTHHAVDAYLNIISGKLINNFLLGILNKKIENEKKECNIKNIICKKIEKDESLNSYISGLNSRHDFLLTYRNKYNDSAFYDMNASKASNSSALTPIHNYLKDTNKYGGYDNLSISYLLKGEVRNKKGQITNILVPVPILDDKSLKEEALKQKLINRYAKNGETLVIDAKKKIYFSQKIYINGIEFLLCPSNKDLCSLSIVSPLFVQSEFLIYLKHAQSFLDRIKEEIKDKNQEKLIIRNKEKEYIFSKEYNKKIFDFLVEISTQSKYKYCLTNIGKISSINFDSFSLSDQIDIIFTCISHFGRNPIFKKYGFSSTLRKSYSSILKDDVYIVNDSITGIYSKKELI